jgi:hypothetical protein
MTRPICPSCGLRVSTRRYHVTLEPCRCPRPNPYVTTWWNTLHAGMTFQSASIFALVGIAILVAAYFIH